MVGRVVLRGMRIDPTGMSYRSGDKYLASARGKTNVPVVFLDTVGRSYAIEPHTLPSGRKPRRAIDGALESTEWCSFYRCDQRSRRATDANEL